MVSYDTNFTISEIKRSIDEIKESVDRLFEVVKPEEDLWDNADIIRNWKVSERTLAEWRRKGMISYVRVSGKIWYPKEARENFIRDHLVEGKQIDGRVQLCR